MVATRLRIDTCDSMADMFEPRDTGSARHRAGRRCWSLVALAGRRCSARLALVARQAPSLAGHARMRAASPRLVPFYAYDEAQFFRSDDAAPRSPTRRRAGFERLSRQLAQRGRARRSAAPPRPPRSISDLQFTDAYRVPFQYSRFVRRTCRPARSSQSSRGRAGHRPRRQPLLRPHRLVRRQRVRLRLLQGLHGARRRARRARSARCSAPTIRWSPTTRAAARRSPAWTRCRSTCRAPRR